MATDGCIVHSRKNVSNFHAAVNQLHRENMFFSDVYEELPKRCCSCNGKQGLKTIDVEILRETCQDIMLSSASTLKFRLSSNANKLLLMKTEEDSSDEEKANNEYLTDTTDDEISHDSILTSDNEDIDDQHTTSDQESITNEFLKVLETFKITTTTDSCIVHNSKYQSKFNYAVNLIRRAKKFKQQIYHELSKRCCSCNEKTGVNVIDLNVLTSICDEIESNRSIKPVLEKSFHVFTLSFESAISFEERSFRICRFIGKEGRNLRALQDKYNVRVHVINKSSNKRLLEKIIKVQDNTEIENIIDADELYLLIRTKSKSVTDTIPIDEIKQEIIEKWDEASEIRFIEREFTFDHTESNKCFQFLSLSFKLGLSSERRREIIGRFIGKKGENLHSLEDEYNIRLHIINGSGNEQYFRKLIEVQENSERQDQNNLDDLYLFITKKNKSITDLIPLDEVKERIIKQWKEVNIEPSDVDELVHFLPLSFDSRLSRQSPSRKTGRFIGKKGQHLRALQDKYNIHVQIVDKSSCKKARKKLAKVKGRGNCNKLCLLITSKNKSTTDTIPINNIKQEITERWENGTEISALTRVHDVNRIQSSKSNSVPIESIELSFDHRWHQKRKRRGK